MNDVIGSTYTNHFEIVDRLSKKFKTRSFDPDTIHDWCAEAENDILRLHEYFSKFIEIKLEIKGGRHITLPCNFHSITDLYWNRSNRPSYHRSKNNIVLNKQTDNKFIYVDYKGTPVDTETGDVLILRGHELFCEWHCIKNSFLEDFLNGKIDANRWAVIDQEYERAENVAVQDMRYMSRKDFEMMDIINGNMLPMIGRVPLYKEGM